MELQALPSRIGQVRRIVSAQLRYWHLDPLIDRAALGVTELLSNVHRHARPDKSCTVELELLPDRLTVSVHDHDPRLPVPAGEPAAPDVTPLATCGRGLAMVAAMSDSWGARPDGDNGKVVWFTLAAAAAAARTHPAGAPGRAAEQRPVPVRPAGVRPAPAPAPVGAGTRVEVGTPVEVGTAVGTATPVGAGAVVGAEAPVAAATAAPAGAAPAVAHASAGASSPGAAQPPTGGSAPAAAQAPAPARAPSPARSTVAG
ncbi:hypothetical protein GCM10010503_19150 [Streptomyces lucensis JCM 4490]|uniref:Histidine kinase/HSP90-like ATPase domain-containing protein n=1 Tax=Streptomyces lucensis JCM 4490 TaxID=1306176 RepID=A0A918J4P9_9ACTN|nr:hypothetical protein GCM10010503_19150 [Streptomyces lucensis JCM 4490]